MTELSLTTKLTKTAEFRIKYVREDRLWRIIHMHSYPNYSFDHPVWTGASWAFCMWLATGDPLYVHAVDKAVYHPIRHYCGVRDAPRTP